MNPAPPLREVDVLVLGGGMSGAFAALAAREGGASVVLVEPSNVLGGQGTAGGVAGFVGDTARVNDAFRELVARLEACDAIDPYRPNQDRRAYDLELCAFALQEMLDRRGVEIWLHARAIDAVHSGGTVEEVVVVCGPTTLRVRPRMVVDATGNAALADMLGCRSVALGALKQLPMSLYFTLWDTGRPIDPARRTLLKVVAPPDDRKKTDELVESLMGRKPELRFAFIQEHARTVEDVDV